MSYPETNVNINVWNEKVFDIYVLIDYWQEGYVVDDKNTWTQVQPYVEGS